MLKKIALKDPLKLAFEPFWFNNKAYLESLPIDEGYTFFQEDKGKQWFIRIVKKDNSWYSPLRAPFGGIEFSKETNVKELYEFIGSVVVQAKSDGIGSIIITAPPECYDIAKADLLDEAFVYSGFSVSVTELNYHLDANMGDFEDFIHDSEKRRLKKCLNAGFKCFIETNPDYRNIHALIADCRLRKGYPLSMNAMEFEKMFMDFPERYTLFVVKDKDTTIAAAVGVKVRSDILYNFLPGDHNDYTVYSPMVLLNKGMYEYCVENGYLLYDLGIATSGGVRNEGLIRFKEHLGGKLSHKYRYEIKIQ
ncbi:MAG TPA: GNAT family N-acetyltransferase [Cytophagaceae bacterium]|jgi:hypothetical protein|nr:GNAT family N-acetyltransferase [Cytophagaceae bacterium]